MPPEGTWFALITNGPEDSSAPDNEDLDGNGEDDYDVTILSQDFTAGSGYLIFKWSWLTGEEDGEDEYDDFFLVRLDGTIILSGSVSGNPSGGSPFPGIPDDGKTYYVASPGPTDGVRFGPSVPGPTSTSHGPPHTSSGRNLGGFQTFSTLITAGTYTIEFIVADQGDDEVDSGLLVDDLAVSPTPEYVITSKWLTISPSIDGVIGPGEWSDATPVIFTSTQGPIPATLYFKNDGANLFIGFDVVGDTTEDFEDGVSVSFDTDHDLVWTPGREDEFIIGPYGVVSPSAAPAPYSRVQTSAQAPVTLVETTHWVCDEYMAVELHCQFDPMLPNHLTLAGARGFGSSPNSGEDHQMYELRIPLALLGAMPGQTLGLFIGSIPMPGILDVSSSYDLWPVWAEGPLPMHLWGNLILAKPKPVGGVSYAYVPVNNLARWAPYLAMIGLVGAVTAAVAMVRRRKP